MADRRRSVGEWMRLALAIGAISLVFVLAAGGRLEVCEDVAFENGTVSRECRGPTATDLAVVAGGVLVILLLAKEFEEIGLFGFSLKQRVQRQEEKATQLEGAIALLDMRVQSTATASARIVIETPERVRGLRQAAPAKGDLFIAEVERIVGERHE